MMITGEPLKTVRWNWYGEISQTSLPIFKGTKHCSGGGYVWQI